MLSRSHLVAAAARAKKLEAFDLALRYNPVARHFVARADAAFAATTDLVSRRVLAERLTAPVIARARKTAYGHQFGPRLQDWPILHKHRLRDAPADFHRAGGLRVPASTSGSTGVPIKLIRSAASVAAEQFFLDRLLPTPGLVWGRARIASLRVDFIKSAADQAPPYGITSHRGRRLILSSSHLNRRTFPWYVERLNAFRADLIWATAGMVANFVHLLEASGLSCQVPLVLTSSERADRALRRAIAESFGAQVIDYYGMAERVCFASCLDTGDYLFEPAYGRVELLPSGQDVVVNGYRHVSIIGTGYWNGAMPLVRFDTGDLALVPADASERDLELISLGLRPFHGIAGRSHDYVYSSDGTRIAGVNHLPREVDNLLQLQVIQEASGAVRVLALVRPSFGPADHARLEVNIRAKLPPDFAYTIELVDRLETTPQGKTPYILQRMASPEQDRRIRSAATLAENAN